MFNLRQKGPIKTCFGTANFILAGLLNLLLFLSEWPVTSKVQVCGTSIDVTKETVVPNAERFNGWVILLGIVWINHFLFKCWLLVNQKTKKKRLDSLFNTHSSFADRSVFSFAATTCRA